MKIDGVITLEDNTNYLILDVVNYEGINYGLATLLDENEDITDESIVFMENHDNNELYVEEVTDEEILINIMKLFTKNFNKAVASLPEE